jgi:hypothetical protein
VGAEVPLHHVLTQVRARVGHDDVEWRLVCDDDISDDCVVGCSLCCC